MALRFSLQSLRPTSAPECGQLLTSIQFESTTKIFQHLSRILFKIFLHVCDARNICDFSSCIIIRVENVGTTCWTSCPLKAKNLGHHNTMIFYNHHVPGLKT